MSQRSRGDRPEPGKAEEIEELIYYIREGIFSEGKGQKK